MRMRSFTAHIEIYCARYCNHMVMLRTENPHFRALEFCLYKFKFTRGVNANYYCIIYRDVDKDGGESAPHWD